MTATPDADFIKRHDARIASDRKEVREVVLTYVLACRRRCGAMHLYKDPEDKEIMKACIRLRGFLYLAALGHGLPISVTGIGD